VFARGLHVRYAANVRRVISLPRRGRLLVATDLQGNVDDFDRIAAIFERAAEDSDDVALVITGDLVHGPELADTEWPDYLGTYYRGDSPTLLEHARSLADRYPGRVHYLLGNHEHAHVGGPVVAKFFTDEAQRLEDLMGSGAATEMRAWMRTWPFVAHAPSAGLLMLHAAPHAVIHGAEDLEQLPLDGFFDLPLDELAQRGALGALLWARTTSTERARAFLAAIHPELRVAVYGHDVARSGHAIDREPLLCVSTSFGCHNGDKLYLDWDLAEHAESAKEVAARGLRPLYPDAPRVFRTAR
jgi:hypothetical protein